MLSEIQLLGSGIVHWEIYDHVYGKLLIFVRND